MRATAPSSLARPNPSLNPKFYNRRRLPVEMRETFSSHSLGINTHIFASAAALLLGPPQFSHPLRVRWPTLHRWAGRVYFGVAVLPGGAAGLYMSYFAFGGVAAKLGFGCLAIAWPSTWAKAMHEGTGISPARSLFFRRLAFQLDLQRPWPCSSLSTSVPWRPMDRGSYVTPLRVPLCV